MSGVCAFFIIFGVLLLLVWLSYVIEPDGSTRGDDT